MSGGINIARRQACPLTWNNGIRRAITPPVACPVPSPVRASHPDAPPCGGARYEIGEDAVSGKRLPPAFRAYGAWLRALARVAPGRADRALMRRFCTSPAWEQGRAVASAWAGARFLSTRGLGHNRIARDDDVIRAMIAFVREAELAPEPVRAAG